MDVKKREETVTAVTVFFIQKGKKDKKRKKVKEYLANSCICTDSSNSLAIIFQLL